MIIAETGGGGGQVIELNAVERCYPMKGQRVRALGGVDLQIARGEFIAITGPSGSGKSTLLNVLGCLDRPDAGHYKLSGIDVGSLNDEQASAIRNRRIGFVFQAFHLLPRLSVLENVLLPRRFAREPLPAIEDRARALLDRVGLGDRLQHRPAELSGGQLQRVAVARALLLEPDLLLADEPTGNLDSRSAQDVLKLIEEVHAAGQTVVIVTHDHEIAERALRQVRIKDGRIWNDTRQ
jgi:putative ABC transport system ATP-binding protein